jgi:hypothetical protein
MLPSSKGQYRQPVSPSRLSGHDEVLETAVHLINDSK